MKHYLSLLSLSALAAGTIAAKRPFSIHDDVLAYPQYKVSFPEEYVLESEASIILDLQKEKSSPEGHSSSNHVSDKRDLERHASQRPIGGWKLTGKKDRTDLDWDPELSLKHFSYQEMKLDGLRYLCNIPKVGGHAENNTTTGSPEENDASKEESQDEIARATERGLELLQEMEDTCMYYVSGWWSYSFCYKKQVKQFHARSGPGVPNYPPIEDPTSHSFVLGRFQREDDEDSDHGTSSNGKSTLANTAELQTKGESRYLVQRLSGGTVCDLTGAERKIEVQFHCHPQSADRIGWIKELTTCSYLMVIYTPRLCHDVAFQVPQVEESHSIQCREILAPEEISEFEAMKTHHDKQKLVDAKVEESYFVGGIEVGAKREVGSEGKVIEKGRMARIGEEIVRLIAKREAGKLVVSSNEDLKKYHLNPKEVENFARQLDEQSEGRDWTLHYVESNGEYSYRALMAVPSTDEDDAVKFSGDEQIPEKEATEKASKKKSEGGSKGEEEGSEETYKDEL